MDGTCANTKRGRRTDNARNLKRFVDQWAEFTEAEEYLALTKINDEDVDYVFGILRIGKYTALATAMEV